MRIAQNEAVEESSSPQLTNQSEDNQIIVSQQKEWNILKGHHHHSRKKHWLFSICLAIMVLAIGGILIDAFSQHIHNSSLLKQQIQKIKTQIPKRPQQSEHQQEVQPESTSSILTNNVPVNAHQKDATTEKDEASLINENEGFFIPKKFWIYDNSDHSYLGDLIFANNKHFAEKSGFEFMVVDRKNFKSYLPKKKAEEVQHFIRFIEEKNYGRGQFIIRIFIQLSLIEENGGIMTDGQCIITEDFDWIRRIRYNPYVNRGNKGFRPQLVAFYAYDHTFDKVKENIKPFPGMNEVDRYMNIFPTLEEYFIAADKNTLFIVQLINKINTLFHNPQQFQQKKYEYRMQNININDAIGNFFPIAVQIILQDRQRQIDSSNKAPYRHFAIDQYGLNLINCYYAPYKYRYFWGSSIREMYIMLTQLTAQQHYDNFGPMSYLTRLTGLSKVNTLLQQTKIGRLEPILEGSLMQELFYPKLDVVFIKKNRQKPFINKTNEPWSTLPKIIWVFYDKGISQARVSNQICVQNMRRMAKISGFEVRQVNTSNAHQYLDSNTISKINYTITNAKLKTFAPSLSDLYRLALISKHGGLYLDSTYLLMENLDWLVNIGRYPSQHIFNRFGHLPKVVMLWYGQGASPFDWKIDERYNTKSMWHLAYESNFIAAQKDNQLIREWFEMLTRLYIKPYNQIAQIFKTECKINEYQWIDATHHYLLVMDSIKCVIGRRQLALMKQGNTQFASASDYYKIWSLNGNLGQQKIRIHSNYDYLRSNDLRFAYRYSQEYTQGIVGKFRQLTKFYSLNGVEMAKFVSAHMDGNFSGEVHPDSIFMRYMWQDNFSLQFANNQTKIIVRS